MNFTFWLYSKNVTFWLLKISECFFFKGWEVSWTMTFFPRHIEYGKILVVWFWHIPVLLAADSDMVKVWNALLIFLHKHCYKAFIYSGWHFTPRSPTNTYPTVVQGMGGGVAGTLPPFWFSFYQIKLLACFTMWEVFYLLGIMSYDVIWCHMMPLSLPSWIHYLGFDYMYFIRKLENMENWWKFIQNVKECKKKYDR